MYLGVQTPSAILWPPCGHFGFQRWCGDFFSPIIQGALDSTYGRGGRGYSILLLAGAKFGFKISNWMRFRKMKIWSTLRFRLDLTPKRTLNFLNFWDSGFIFWSCQLLQNDVFDPSTLQWEKVLTEEKKTKNDDVFSGHWCRCQSTARMLTDWNADRSCQYSIVCMTQK